MRKFKDHFRFVAVALFAGTAFFSCSKVAQKEEAPVEQKIDGNPEYFYYYKNQKKLLVLNTEYVFVASKKPLTNTYKNLGVITEIPDPQNEKADVRMNQKNAGQTKTLYRGKLKLSKKLTREEYGPAMSFVQEDPNIEYLTPFFEGPQGPGGPPMTVSQYFYVKLQSESDLQTLYNVANTYGASVEKQHETMPLWWVLSSGYQSSITMANTFYQTGLFTYAEPDFMVENILTCPSDPRFPTQWGANNTGQRGGIPGIDIKACQAWDLTWTGTVIDVAVIDNQVDVTHEDLVSGLYDPLVSHDATMGLGSINYGDHGTYVAGVVGARENDKGITGVAPYCRLMPIAAPMNVGLTPQVGLALSQAIDWAWKNGAEVITCSWLFVQSPYIDEAIMGALWGGRNGKGCVVVFSAGNDNAPVVYPARFPGVIAVGAANPCGSRVSPGDCINDTWGSCYGSELSVVAPGTRITTTGRPWSGLEPNVPYTERFDGTSAAAPAVAGVAALILSKNPTLTGIQVKNIIESTAQKTGGYAYAIQPGHPNGLWHQEVGYGLVDATAAVLATPPAPPGSTIGLEQYVSRLHGWHD